MDSNTSQVTMMIQEGLSHHPHSLRDPKPIADFIEGCFRKTFVPVPAFAGKNYTKSYFYGIDNIYRYFDSEKTYITCRGPFFSDCFNRYEFRIEGNLRVNVIAPNKPAPGNPWVFRTDFVERDAIVDLALLAKGFSIVTGPVPTSTDGPLIEQWNTVYKYLTDKGFSKKSVMQGAGGATGEAYPGQLRTLTKFLVYMVRTLLFTVTWQKYNQSTIWLHWQKPVYRFCMFAVVLIRGLLLTPVLLRNDIRNLEARSLL